MGELKLTAFDVTAGDSYLLEFNDKKILVDGGTNINELSGVPNVLDLVVCTHYDDDHVKGIVNLLNSKTTKVNELWLPDDMSLAGKYIQREPLYIILLQLKEAVESHLEFSAKDRMKVGERICRVMHHHLKEMYFEFAEIEDRCECRQNDDDESEQDNNRFIKRKIELLKGIYLRCNDYTNDADYLYSDEIVDDDNEEPKEYQFMRLYGDLLNTFARAAELKLITDGVKVRWFKYDKKKDCLNVNKSAHSIRVINAVETVSRMSKPLIEYACCFLNARYESNKKNRESLVLLFDDEKYPNILFNGDSSLYWLDNKKPLVLKCGAVITAPHHGSRTGLHAYDTEYICDDHGLNKDFVFVRSDSPCTPRYGDRPCVEYVSMKNKYCRDCVSGGSKRLVLTFNGRINTTVEKYCTCKAK